MNYLRINANECNYKKHDRQLKKEIINEIGEKMMTAEIKKVNQDVKQLVTLQVKNC